MAYTTHGMLWYGKVTKLRYGGKMFQRESQTIVDTLIQGEFKKSKTFFFGNRRKNLNSAFQ
jgi:hypothetical protein